MACLAAASASVQVFASVAFPCGVEAAVFHALRLASRVVCICARILAGTLSFTHASYLLMYSSHSATPVTAALVVVLAGVAAVFVVFVVVVVVVVLPDALVVVVLVLVVVVVLSAGAPHATSTAQAALAASVSTKALIVWFSSDASGHRPSRVCESVRAPAATARRRDAWRRLVGEASEGVLQTALWFVPGSAWSAAAS
jgi:hypothetical protein